MILEIEALNLGDNTRAISMELVEPGTEREPVGGSDAAKVWSRVVPAIAAGEPLALDFCSQLEGVREFCTARHIACKRTEGHLEILLPSDEIAARQILAELIERFEGDTFGVRAGNLAGQGDAELESELSERGIDAYHQAYPRYTFCAICMFDEASITLLAQGLWATEVVRRVAPAVVGIDVQVRQPV